MPVFCDHCGLVFPSRAFVFADEQQATLNEVGETCPRCANVAFLPSGMFNIVGGTLEVLEATPLTRARLSQLGNVLDRARRGEISEDALADEIEREGGPTAVAELLRKTPPKLRRVLILILLFAVQTLAAHEVDQLLSDTPTQAQLAQGFATLSQQLSDDHKHVHGEIDAAVKQALAAYNRERHPPAANGQVGP
jgi:hypothetical protein